MTQSRDPPKEKKLCSQVKIYIEEYLKLIKEVNNLESYAGRKIIMKLIQYLEEFPTMNFLV